MFGWNYLASQDSGGVTIQIARLLLANKADLPASLQLDQAKSLDDTPVVGELLFIVQNNAQVPVNVYPDQGQVIAGSEQIELLEFARGNRLGEDVSGTLYPGVKRIGGLWFGFRRTSLEQIQSLRVVIKHPFDESLNSLGPDFDFALDLTVRKQDPLPEELK